MLGLREGSSLGWLLGFSEVVGILLGLPLMLGFGEGCLLGWLLGFFDGLELGVSAVLGFWKEG